MCCCFSQTTLTKQDNVSRSNLTEYHRSGIQFAFKKQKIISKRRVGVARKTGFKACALVALHQKKMISPNAPPIVMVVWRMEMPLSVKGGFKAVGHWSGGGGENCCNCGIFQLSRGLNVFAYREEGSGQLLKYWFPLCNSFATSVLCELLWSKTRPFHKMQHPQQRIKRYSSCFRWYFPVVQRFKVYDLLERGLWTTTKILIPAM